jgi:hypothetical protein
MQNNTQTIEYMPIRRQVNHDHSCLFSSVAYLTDRKNFNENSSHQYRGLIVNYLLTNDIEESCLINDGDNGYNPSDIESSTIKERYIETISNPNTWGGQNELEMFSNIFKIQIIVYDIQTNNMYTIGNVDYENRIYLLWTRTHYDPLVMNTNESTDSTTDVTIFKSDDSDIYNKFQELGKSISDQKSTKSSADDTSLMLLKCTDCEEIFTSKSDATSHARSVDHWNFKQI